MSAEQKSEVSSITGMGFPSPRVARALLRCKEDKTKVRQAAGGFDDKSCSKINVESIFVSFDDFLCLFLQFNKVVTDSYDIFFISRYLIFCFLLGNWRNKVTVEIALRQHSWPAMRNQRRYNYNK